MRFAGPTRIGEVYIRSDDTTACAVSRITQISEWVIVKTKLNRVGFSCCLPKSLLKCFRLSVTRVCRCPTLSIGLLLLTYL
ncbi:unnamed protein product, partial [Vitis vinifera]